MGRNGVARRGGPAGTWSLALLFAAACQNGAWKAPPGEGAGTARAAAVATTAAAPILACVPTDAHAKHATAGIGCNACHVCGGQLGFDVVSFPGGTSTTGMTAVPNGSATTCSGGCHAPLGASPQPVAWNAGPLPCTSCHTNVLPPAGPVVSSHVSGGDSTACAGCHDLSQHTSGAVRFVGGGAGTSCVACHGGQGQTLAGQTPPLLVGWSDPAGDFHGPRTACRVDELDASGNVTWSVGGLACPPALPAAPSAAALRVTPLWAPVTRGGAWAWTCNIDVVDAAGNVLQPTLTGQPCPGGTYFDNPACPTTPSSCRPTTAVVRGYGGTLQPPYARGQDALPCTACHAFHSSANAFMLAGVVNGVPVAPNAITRSGMGAEALCGACHQGQRHQVCMRCHTVSKVFDPSSGTEVFDPSSGPADPMPAGSPCFWCHGHEGIRFWTQPGQSMDGNMQDGSCQHCHGFGQPPLRTTPPPLTTSCGPPGALPRLSSLRATSAVISWQTCGVLTNGYVEYGVATAGTVVGTTALAVDHQQAITGLAPSTTYVYRVRSSDVYRNFVESPLQTFTTIGVDAVPAPDLTPVGTTGVESPATTMTVPLGWSAVSAPTGNPVQYRAVVSTDPAFGASLLDTGWITGTTASVTLTGLPYGCVGVNTYYWHVQARDAMTGATSSWSTADVFWASSYDPWGC
jgi:hypothetical protein